MKYTFTTTHIILYNPKVDHHGYEVVNVTIICVAFILHSGNYGTPNFTLNADTSLD